MEELLNESTRKRLARVAAGEDTSVSLKTGNLQPGQAGVITATVQHIAPQRTFQRKRGGEGCLQRVTLDDGSGSVDLVLWDDESRFIRDGPFIPGAVVRLAGPTVKEGWRGGVELHLGACVPVPAEAPSHVDLEGTILEFGSTEPVLGDEGPRFRAEVHIRTLTGAVWVVVWDDQLKQLREAGVGSQWQFSKLSPHPALSDWYLADAATMHPLDS